MHLFDKGWNDLREQIFANQKRLGVIPANSQLTPWPDGQPEFGGAKLAKWETLTPDEKKLFIRQADVLAAYTAYTDHEIGRVIQAVEDMGKLDNTLISTLPATTAPAPKALSLAPRTRSPQLKASIFRSRSS
jgi:arylsulfatase A-like enzyme